MDYQLSTATIDAPAAADSFTRGRVLATDLEVLTVTPTSVVISWVTHAARLGIAIPKPVAVGTEVAIGPVGGPMQLVHEDPTPRVYHVVEITGLEPGRTYQFQASSEGKLAAAALSDFTLSTGTCQPASVSELRRHPLFVSSSAELPLFSH